MRGKHELCAIFTCDATVFFEPRGFEMNRPYFAAFCGLFAFLVVSVVGTAPAAAGPAPAVSPPPITLESMFIQAQAGCGRVRAFCRGRWGGGPQYRRCVRNRGCRVGRRPTYCQRMYRRCAGSYVPGRRPFARCMRRNGC